MDSDSYLMISGIQHFAFCRRQWALIHVEDQWNENGLTAEGRVMHNRVHDTSLRDYRKGTIVIHGMSVKSDRYGITGQCDAVELVPSEDGITLNQYPGKWKVFPVEYKHGKPKTDDCDRLQVAAQALCLEEMLLCHIDTGWLYYGETRHREKIEINEELRQETIRMFEEMHGYMDRGYTPVVKPSQKCRQCSLGDLCMPNLLKKNSSGSVHEYIMRHINED